MWNPPSALSTVPVPKSSSPEASFLKLCRLGVDFPTNQYGEYVGYKTDHDPCARGTSIGRSVPSRSTEMYRGSTCW